MTQTLDYAPNYANIIELDITPNNKEPTWAWAQVGAKNCAPSANETMNEDAYYHNLGSTETNVDSVKFAVAVTGDRRYGDPCQDFVASCALGTGKSRKTRYRWTMPDGTMLKGECTLTNLVPGGSAMGDANAKGTMSYTINLNTVELVSEGSSIMPESVTVADATVAVGKTAESGARVAPAEASQRCHYAIDDVDIATVDQDGKITGVASGETTITVKAAGKPSVVAQAKITVGAAAPASSSK